MRASIRADQVLERFAQSARLGTRPAGSSASSRADLLQREPDLCANTMKATRRITAAGSGDGRPGALGGQQAALLVEAQRGGGDAAALGQLPMVSGSDIGAKPTRPGP